MKDSFETHIAMLQRNYAMLFESCARTGTPIDGLLIHSGSNEYYYGDDQAISFRAYGHFCHWLPINRPEQIVLIEPGRRPIYFQVIPGDYWYDSDIAVVDWWSEQFEIITVSKSSEIQSYLRHRSGLGFIGHNVDCARMLGLDESRINPSQLLHGLDYLRAYKSGYEIEQIKTANSLALQGHNAARTCFLNGGSEYDIHMAYLLACGILEEECPYTNIVALDEKAAILHYQNKRHVSNNSQTSQVLLLDAGCRSHNYCSDITRTTIYDSTHPVFQSLVRNIEAVQLKLVDRIKPGMDYLELHLSALENLNAVLIDHDVIRCDIRQSMELELPSLFMPHGIGHLLGIQVHDVGGHLASIVGEKKPPPEKYPYLRNTRMMEENMVFTVEPGLYFVPLLLDPQRTSDRGKFLNWSLIDELLPCGGIRIEDNIRVGATAAENLTRRECSDAGRD